MKDVYNTQYWSEGYFEANEDGELCACTLDAAGKRLRSVPFSLIADALQTAGLRWPVLVRFPHILRDRVARLSNAFSQAMYKVNYEKRFVVVYPIKVNQQRNVVKEIIQCHEPEQGRYVGLEAGSKPELLAVLGMAKTQESLVVCNGYKDESYVRLALLGQQMGLTIFLVIEKLSELDLVLEQAQLMGLSVRLGVRIRLSLKGKSNWQNSGGEKSKFGLCARSLIEMVDILKQRNALNCLQLLHFHMGSQISDIKDVRACMSEATRFFIELGHLGANIQWLDVGGGLGVDYEGTCSTSYCSVNYDVDAYAKAIVDELKLQCDKAKISLPNIIAESGRALTAHHAVLLAQVTQLESPLGSHVEPEAPHADVEDSVRDVWEDYQTSLAVLDERKILGLEHGLRSNFSRVTQDFLSAKVSLKGRALAELYYYAACEQINRQLDGRIDAHRALQNRLNDKLAYNLFVNFSLFQSMPDAWGIGQIFPVVPLKDVNAGAHLRARVQDMTCDSDGCIKDYVDGMGIETTLPIPETGFASQDLLGMFLVGAYQEILGDMHNLFGDTDSADVDILPGQGAAQTGLQVSAAYRGDTVEKVLQVVNFDRAELTEAIASRLGETNFSREVQASFMEEIKESFNAYTYLEP